MLAGSMGATIWLSELIWRDFYFMILANHPRLAEGAAFKPDYENIEWESGAHAQKLFKAWCDGKTGYPLVDAAMHMHQLNQSGYMHNRLRMVVASFLTKEIWELIGVGVKCISQNTSMTLSCPPTMVDGNGPPLRDATRSRISESSIPLLNPKNLIPKVNLFVATYLN